jgi:CRP/FNR family transcriptional regulator, cyclic AMP receptor protein
LLSDVDRERLLALGGPRRYARGEHLMHQGEPEERVLVLLEGHVKTIFVGPEGRETVLSFRGPGDILGELSFTRAESRSNDVVAIEPVRARSLSAAEFLAFVEGGASAAMTVIEVLGRRFRDANRIRVQFGGSDTVGRLAARLLELSERFGLQVEDGIEIGVPVTQTDLGGLTASSRAGVAEALRTMRELGWIRTSRRRITVLDSDALGARAG